MTKVLELAAVIQNEGKTLKLISRQAKLFDE